MKNNKRKRITIQIDSNKKRALEFDSINDGIKYRNETRSKKWHALKDYERYIKEEREIEKWLLNNCNHDWKRSEIDYGPYDKPPWVCQICGIEN
jgi:hypothetical protein